ncbi:hypothetical protein B0H16DRAFT_1589308 [Mycena metata]|uniref:Uncharacterized protein n=1 Tax=Mycena metata TaxID=1033252 RepID=A0AAD7HTX7_9AGAR|nr:hypothetical protein B0H16DRAFT_1589308 [Mycena metata]
MDWDNEIPVRTFALPTAPLPPSPHYSFHPLHTPSSTLYQRRRPLALPLRGRHGIPQGFPCRLRLLFFLPSRTAFAVEHGPRLVTRRVHSLLVSIRILLPPRAVFHSHICIFHPAHTPPFLPKSTVRSRLFTPPPPFLCPYHYSAKSGIPISASRTYAIVRINAQVCSAPMTAGRNPA